MGENNKKVLKTNKNSNKSVSHSLGKIECHGSYKHIHSIAHASFYINS